MCRNFLKQIPSLLDCPHSRQISTSCRYWFKSRRRGRSVLIRVRRYVGVRINSLARYIRSSSDPRAFFSFATGKRDAGKDPVSGANVFRTINISILAFLPSSSLELPLVLLTGSFRQKPLVLSLIAESWSLDAWLASFASARRWPWRDSSARKLITRGGSCIFTLKPARDHFEHYCEWLSRYDLLLYDNKIIEPLQYFIPVTQRDFFIIISILLDYNDNILNHHYIIYILSLFQISSTF